MLHVAGLLSTKDFLPGSSACRPSYLDPKASVTLRVTPLYNRS